MPDVAKICSDEYQKLPDKKKAKFKSRYRVFRKNQSIVIYLFSALGCDKSFRKWPASMIDCVLLQRYVCERWVTVWVYCKKKSKVGIFFIHVGKGFCMKIKGDRLLTHSIPDRPSLSNLSLLFPGVTRCAASMTRNWSSSTWHTLRWGRYRVFIKYGVFRRFQSISEIPWSTSVCTGFSRRALGVSVCTPNFTLGPLNGRSITNRTDREKKKVLKGKTQLLINTLYLN